LTRLRPCGRASPDSHRASSGHDAATRSAPPAQRVAPFGKFGRRGGCRPCWFHHTNTCRSRGPHVVSLRAGAERRVARGPQHRSCAQHPHPDNPTDASATVDTPQPPLQPLCAVLRHSERTFGPVELSRGKGGSGSGERSRRPAESRCPSPRRVLSGRRFGLSGCGATVKAAHASRPFRSSV
jgi:hypothetical protein